VGWVGCGMDGMRGLSVAVAVAGQWAGGRLPVAGSAGDGLPERGTDCQLRGDRLPVAVVLSYRQ